MTGARSVSVPVGRNHVSLVRLRMAAEEVGSQLVLKKRKSRGRIEAGEYLCPGRAAAEVQRDIEPPIPV